MPFAARMKHGLLIFLLLAPAAGAAAQDRFEVFLAAETVRATRELTHQPGVRFTPVFENAAGAGLGVNWFFHEHFSLSLKASALATRLQIRDAGSDYVSIINAGWGSFYPLSAVLQWHPASDWRVRPYIGAGPVYTIVPDVEPTEIVPRAVFNNQSGVLVVAGVRVPLWSRITAFGDVRAIPVHSRATVRFAEQEPAELDIRPLVISAGLSYAF